ncbi:homogentisate phytyltransferase [Anabaena subtropica]|uniref:Homogentisate phytyltransferase n=1 Tax=Anabaena subtropica FACHB-260 TaxID=2692884 RepID=A0ABR8CIA5_9NOST|nr:homogentisate phytyltransferase [Anabaena subtropica]MBD2342563.1 homogentisate phytyltransferase [Anabaena subtropica FACHB-260]
MSQSSQNSPSQRKPLQSPFQWLYAFWKFSRPHTIIGTSLSVLGLYLISLSVSPTGFAVTQLTSVLGAWLACLCGNVYIVGLNQLEDIEIDKVNKPHLPLASGEFSRRQGLIIVIFTGITALVLAWLNGPYLLGMVAISLAIGTAYSLPPIRLKQFPFWAALCIFSVRGTIVNLGLYLHFSWLLQNKQSIPLPVWVLTVFILVFTFAIAIFKDIPDMEGDRLYNITTFTIQLGPQAVFNLALWVLTVCYLGMVMIGVLRLGAINSVFLVITHLVVLCWMWMQSLTVDIHDRTAIAQFYQFIWKLFFLEYLMFPIACLLA